VTKKFMMINGEVSVMPQIGVSDDLYEQIRAESAGEEMEADPGGRVVGKLPSPEQPRSGPELRGSVVAGI
ncbi:hypothetical protein, partial [Halapricum sp. CBA1109]|uniref:hypothetical protein n=1 Tax=Halapricum sp. CBA1109 TaxID=2668068 RepID=UPI001E330D24